jgi:hypothetical protein
MYSVGALLLDPYRKLKNNNLVTGAQPPTSLCHPGTQEKGDIDMKRSEEAEEASSKEEEEEALKSLPPYHSIHCSTNQPAQA